MTARFTTTAPAGYYGRGLLVDVITLTGSTGATAPGARDFHTTPGGDGQQFRVRHPNGILIGMCRTPADLTALGIDLGSLVEVTA